MVHIIWTIIYFISEVISKAVTDLFFWWILISKMDVKMNLRTITKNHAADSKIGSSLEIDFSADWTHESNPTAWVLSDSMLKKCRLFIFPKSFPYPNSHIFFRAKRMWLFEQVLIFSKNVIPSPVKLPYLAETIDISTASKIILFILKYLYVKKVKIHSLWSSVGKSEIGRAGDSMLPW